jgi:16S rRNA processing protein RimM
VNSSAERIAVGKITKSHGVRGEVNVLPLTEVPGRFETDATLWLEDGRALKVDDCRKHHGGLIVSFTDVRDREGADSLHGQYLFVPESDLPELPEDSYWPHQIEGCEVFDEEGRPIGVVTDVLHTEANDVWVAKEGDKETLLPALKESVKSVDVGAKRIVVVAPAETE